MLIFQLPFSVDCFGTCAKNCHLDCWNHLIIKEKAIRSVQHSKCADFYCTPYFHVQYRKNCTFAKFPKLASIPIYLLVERKVCCMEGTYQEGTSNFFCNSGSL